MLAGVRTYTVYVFQLVSSTGRTMVLRLYTFDHFSGSPEVSYPSPKKPTLLGEVQTCL